MMDTVDTQAKTCALKLCGLHFAVEIVKLLVVTLHSSYSCCCLGARGSMCYMSVALRYVLLISDASAWTSPRGWLAVHRMVKCGLSIDDGALQCVAHFFMSLLSSSSPPLLFFFLSRRLEEAEGGAGGGRGDWADSSLAVV